MARMACFGVSWRDMHRSVPLNLHFIAWLFCACARALVGVRVPTIKVRAPLNETSTPYIKTEYTNIPPKPLKYEIRIPFRSELLKKR